MSDTKIFIHNRIIHTTKHKSIKAKSYNCKHNRSGKSRLCSKQIKTCVGVTIEEKVKHEHSYCIKNSLDVDDQIVNGYSSEINKMTKDLVLKNLSLMPNETWKFFSEEMNKKTRIWKGMTKKKSLIK